ncbi:MAG: hypothetical protein ACRD22_02670 [Terriglobia bacterium]
MYRQHVSKPDHMSDVKYCLKHPKVLNEWELDFLLGLLGFAWISDKQEAKLDNIVRKVELAVDVLERGELR